MKKIILSILLFSTISSLYALDLTKECRVAFAQDSLSDEYRLSQVKELESSLLEYPNIEFSYSDGDSSLSMQVMQVEDFIMQGVDILILSTFDTNVSLNIISQAYDFEIPVILINQELNSSKFTSYIDTSDQNVTKDINQTLEAIFTILSITNQDKGEKNEH